MTEIVEEIARDYGLPVKNQYGQFQVGGPIGGHAGLLDKLYELSPGIGDIRALNRGAKAGAETRVRSDLMGGASVDAPRRGEAAFEIGTALPVMGDVAASAKVISSIMADYGALGALGRIVFHGSPHKFSKFSHKMMGSGEGAQAYGWGTYLAENPDVAQQYRQAGKFFTRADGSLPQHAALKGVHWKDLDDPVAKQSLSNFEDLRYYADDDPRKAAQMLREAEISKPEDAALLQELFDNDPNGLLDISGPIEKTQTQRMADWLDANADDIKMMDSTNLYEVDLPDDQIAKMLDWDAPLSEQTKKLMQENIDKFPDPRITQYMLEQDGITGGAVYGGIVSQYGDDAVGTAQQHGSELLNELGIPGIKYWDGGSRSAAEGTRNFVVFDEDLMTILKRNDELLDAL